MQVFYLLHIFSLYTHWLFFHPPSRCAFLPANLTPDNLYPLLFVSRHSGLTFFVHEQLLWKEKQRKESQTEGQHVAKDIRQRI